jgi:hypothetical protein
MNRHNLSLSKKLILGTKSLIRLCANVLKRNITFMQAILDIRMRLFNSQRSLGDDFDWSKYPRHYREEIKSASRKHTLIVGVEDFSLINGQVVLSDKNAKPLHPNHRLLYEVLVQLNPNSVREIGFGAGDHLSNLSSMLPDSKLYGIDRSVEQLETLRIRHPKLQADLSVTDITDRQIALETVELSFTQAVLMHISELNNRYLNAMVNILDSTSSQIVLIEHWTQHDYIGSIRRLIDSKQNWQGAEIYFAVSSEDPNVRCMVVSKSPCSFPLLLNDDQLLQGQNLLTH